MKVFRVFVVDKSTQAFQVEAETSEKALELVHASLERGEEEPPSMTFESLWESEWETTGEVEEMVQ